MGVVAGVVAGLVAGVVAAVVTVVVGGVFAGVVAWGGVVAVLRQAIRFVRDDGEQLPWRFLSGLWR